ncbi:hypothetical protein CLCR_10952 [Cladophialophora carrionii]|uniref:Uncharacterized protein n=1 Tax=Cladophialophora carrionii TaxID=86049 RepID=A0A1C1CVY4_9EURO|nr:hypothetical protein CLCR_10952 [Cladophialophora carrionii]
MSGRSQRIRARSQADHDTWKTRKAEAPKDDTTARQDRPLQHVMSCRGAGFGIIDVDVTMLEVYHLAPGEQIPAGGITAPTIQRANVPPTSRSKREATSRRSRSGSGASGTVQEGESKAHNGRGGITKAKGTGSSRGHRLDMRLSELTASGEVR